MNTAIVLVRPIVPDVDTVVYKILDIGLTHEHPLELMENSFEIHLLGGQQWKLLGNIQSHLNAKHASSTCTCAVAAYWGLKKLFKNIEILNFNVHNIYSYCFRCCYETFTLHRSRRGQLRPLL
jgi:hypothetical protein